MPQRKPKKRQLFGGRREQEITLIPAAIGSTMQFRSGDAVHALDVVPSCHAISFEVLRGFQQVLELYTLVAANTGNRCCTGQITVSKLVYHRVFKDVFVIQYIVGKTHFFRNPPRVMNVYACAARPLFRQCSTMIIKLQCHAHNVIAFFGQHCRDHRAVNAAGHGDDNARFTWRLGKPKRVQRWIVIQWHDDLRDI